VTPQPRPVDRALVDEIRERNTAAETALYEGFSARVYYLAWKLLRAHDRAEDARAETFLRVFEAIRQDRLRAPEALPSFILQTTHNVVRESRRREWRADRLSRQLSAVSREPSRSPELRPRVLRALEDTVAALGDRERAFLRMYYYEELPAAVIATRLGIKGERIRLVKSRTLQRLREAYARATGPDDRR
jgi:RNA polymerase sigma factor (sigma-70 family)